MMNKRAFAVLTPLRTAIFFLIIGVMEQVPAQDSGQQSSNLTTEAIEMGGSFTLSTARVIDAPVERVWDAWHDPAKIAKWWGPAGFHSTVTKLEIRPGGRFEVVMHGPDGTNYANVYVFDQVVEHRRLVYTNLGSEEFGLAPFNQSSSWRA